MLWHKSQGAGGVGGGGGVTEGWTSDYAVLASPTSSNVNSTATNGWCNIWYKRSFLRWVFTQSEMQALAEIGSATQCTIEKLRFGVTNAPIYSLPSYAIALQNFPASTSNTYNPSTSSGWTVVKNTSTESFPVGVKTFNFNTNFTWTGGALGISVAWGAVQNYNQSGRAYIASSGRMYYTWTDGAGTYSVTASGPTNQRSWRPICQFYVSP